MHKSLVRPTSVLAKQMCEDVGPYQHHDISIIDFVHHIWGLDRSIVQTILDMDLKLDPRALYAYRRSECEGDLYAPFTGFAKILHGEVVTRLAKAEMGEASADEFWEEVETGNLMTAWVAHTPSEGAAVNLGIAKHILEFKHDRYKDTGSFLTQSQRARMKTDTFTSGPNQRSRANVARHRGVNSERCRASPDPNSSSESDLAPLHSHNRKRRRRQSHSSSDSHRPAKRRRRFHDAPHLLDSAIECMSVTSRRWVTGLLIDTCEVTACYFDRNLVVCSESFRFDRDPSILALVVYAMSRCVGEHAGFDPYHVSSPLRLSLDQRLQGDVELPVTEVVGSFFDFTFRRREDCVDDKALGSHVPLKERARCEKRKGEEGEEGEKGNKGDEERDKKATESKPDTDHQDAQHISPHRSTCFRVVDFIRQPDDDDLINRGTAVYKVQRRLASGTFSDDYYALKFSWAMKSRLSEIDAIQHLRTALPETSHDHLPDLFFSQSWTAEQLRLPWLNLKLSLNEEGYRERVLRVFSSKYYKKLWQAGSIENFKQAWLDCVEVCYLAYRMGKVLHQDLSENNIMVLPLSGGGVKGVVNDWDMAKFVEDQKDHIILDSGCGTGTPPFMAREFLYPGGLRLSTPHWFRHDLESLFYVLIWAAIQYNLDQGTRDEEYHPFLESWTEHAAANSSSKAVFIAGGYKQEDALLAAVKPEFKQVAEEWILPLRTLFRNAEFYGGQVGDLNHDPCTYGGRLTFKTFMKAINVIPRTWGIANYLEDD